MRKKSPPPRLVGKRTTLSFYFTLLFFAALLILASSCQKDEVLDQTAFNPVEEKEGMIKLGKKLENPYTVDNMRKAYANLVSRGILKSGITIDATHLYIRFLPATDQEMEDFEATLLNYLSEEELEFMEDEFSADFYDYPLDYEIYEGGTYYYDPELPPGGITWQYTVVPVNFPIPAVQHERIADLFLNGTDIEIALSAGGSGTGDFWDLLETEALNLAGYPVAEIPASHSLKSNRWRPSGRIRVWDDVLGRLIPLQGAKVRARWFFFTNSGLTDSVGYYAVNGTFKGGRSVSYCIKWERADWDIRSGMFFQAYYNGPNRDYAWNQDIVPGGKSIMYATMHRAANKYFYGDNLGIRRPTLFYGGKTKICYRDGNGTGVFWGDWSVVGIVPDIQVWGRRDGNYKTTEEIFGTTIHELAHQAHSQYINNYEYWFISKVIYESWADAVEWALTNDEYHKLGHKFSISAAINYDHPYNNHKDWPFVNDKAYSPIFIDLVDDKNQRLIRGDGYPNDLITGYTLAFIHNNILKKSYGLSSLRDEIKKNKIAGVTDAQIDELFALYW